MTTIDFYLCLLKDAISFCTVMNAAMISDGYIGLKNCTFHGVQDGLKLVISHESRINSVVHDCHFDMTRYSPNEPSHAITITGGTAEVKTPMILLRPPSQRRAEQLVF